eukprot:CAMPEP_0115039796 /NCGR_PEP_ID=MMETSP0216-20121206/44335_1 /TAXON_ID=223996 /ORGANISM="Protocruzia adherens, Strain Boccale" /LENGTH=110 /DNA_ID=CAMNT_0002420691 /DNA_START=252 /DNA_END=584 /DNA_ORIENTATION=+
MEGLPRYLQKHKPDLYARFPCLQRSFSSKIQDDGNASSVDENFPLTKLSPKGKHVKTASLPSVLHGFGKKDPTKHQPGMVNLSNQDLDPILALHKASPAKRTGYIAVEEK